MELIALANEFKIPIIADEVYYGLSFDKDRPFHSFGNLTSDVPIIVSYCYNMLVYWSPL